MVEPHRIQTLSFPIHTSRGYMAGSVIRDVTGIKKAEEALSRSEERLRFITDNMLDMISYVNADLALEYVSPSVISIAGYRRGRIDRLSIIPFIHPDDVDDTGEGNWRLYPGQDPKHTG